MNSSFSKSPFQHIISVSVSQFAELAKALNVIFRGFIVQLNYRHGTPPVTIEAAVRFAAVRKYASPPLPQTPDLIAVHVLVHILALNMKVCELFHQPELCGDKAGNVQWTGWILCDCVGTLLPRTHCWCGSGRVLPPAAEVRGRRPGKCFKKFQSKILDYWLSEMAAID